VKNNISRIFVWSKIDVIAALYDNMLSLSNRFRCLF